MNLRGRIPVEPLDEDRIVRVERSIVAGCADAMAHGERRGARRWLPTLALAGAAAATAALVMWTLRSAPAADEADAPVRIEAADDHGARVDLGDLTIAASPGAAFVVTRPASGVTIELDRGAIELDVASRAGRPPLVVRAADVDVFVVGTRFSVERGADVAIAVTEGVVRVRRGDQETAVAAGQRWSAPAQVATGQDPFPPVTPIAIATTGPAPGQMTPSGEIVLGDPGSPPELRDRTAAAPAPERRGSEGRTGSGGDDRRGSRGDPRPATGAGSAGTRGDRSRAAELRSHPVATPFDVGALGAAALEIYTGMIGGRGDDKRRGIYGAAYTLRGLGESAQALRWLDAYRTQFQTGAELDDVLWLRIQIRCEHEVTASCRRDAHELIRKFPGSARAEIANRITNEL